MLRSIGKLVVSRLGLATDNLQTKFEVSNHTHCEDMKNGAKCHVHIGGSLGQLGATQGRRQCHHSIYMLHMPCGLNVMDGNAHSFQPVTALLT